MNRFLFDTCFLIDLERELLKGPAKAHRYLERNRAARPCLSWTVVGEFAEGFDDIQDPACVLMLDRFDILTMRKETARQYAAISRKLRAENRLIGTNDLWIAAAALADDLPLVTNNASHFSRVPQLAVVGY